MQSKKTKLLTFVPVIIIALALIYIFSDYGTKNLDLNLGAPNEIMIGVPFDLTVEISNQSGAALKEAKLTVDLPDGAAFVGSSEGNLRKNKDLGTVGEGSLTSEIYQIIFLKGEGSAQKIKVSVAYTTASLAAHFEESDEKEISVKGPGVSVELAGPEKVFSGEEFEMEVKYKNVSEADFSGLEFRMEYPPNFSFISSVLKPDMGNNVWKLGDLRKGSEGDFAIKGSIVGPEGSEFSFKPEMKITLRGQSYAFEIKETVMSISESPLSLDISLNDEGNYVSKLGDELNYILSYINNTDVALRDVTIRAQLVGELFDFNNLETNALLRRSDNTLIWNSSNAAELNYLAPHSAGLVKFKIKTKDAFPIKRFGDKNFVLKVNAEIESPTVPGFVSASRTFSMNTLETKVSGTMAVETKGYFRDAASGILNKGDLPLRVGQPINFTIHWFLKSFASDLVNVELRAALAEGVRFTNNVKSSDGAVPSYNEESREVVWALNSVVANKGVVDKPAEGVFQIEVTPPASYVGKYMPLIGDISVKAVDNYTSSEIKTSAAATDSSMPYDNTVGQGGIVQP
ncbi:MAG: hypothetical protein PHN74_03235 [Candidatus Pacebacteria bacterium]|nr:hypothetical protein [Candidatus Paceibacterota bacterium]